MNIPETTVAASTIAYLENLHWEVFQEVTGAPGRADIVARQGSLLWVIECKITFGFPVLAQARAWQPYAHLVSVSTPSQPNPFAQEVCRSFGIGALRARGPFNDGSGTTEIVRPRLNRKPVRLPKLCEEHKTYAPAGTNGGGYFTPFTRTCKAVKELMHRYPEGLPLKKLVDGIEHHYHNNSTARNCLRNWIRWGKVPGVTLKIESGKAVVYPQPTVRRRDEALHEM